ncbi:ribonuclease E-like [Sebastes umbrosus]|uniref:ribonuclease E-like n=1 Tax=Sebastes umbrosus TaxID=72105 RepID=UPI00189CC00A|nr:ribonuclease E-like [Sebastes umbrosus]XP_037633033.1 ribonuclease E-like [Sebastes umbrosus]XP_037633034.1 ribonuclease E-like [Sebastes umbrosus]XP_037633035.1 ribonuclease E-like [Sebastes umbrosus]
MSFSRPRSPTREELHGEEQLLLGAAGVSHNDHGSGSSQNSDGVAERAEVLPQLIRPNNLRLYIVSDDEAPEVEEGEYIPPLSSDDDEDDEDVSVFQFEDGEVYPLSDDEDKDEETLDDSGYDTTGDEDADDGDDVGLRSPVIQESTQQRFRQARRRVLPPVPTGSPVAVPVGVPAGPPVHLHPPFGIRLLFLRD